MSVFAFPSFSFRTTAITQCLVIGPFPWRYDALTREAPAILQDPQGLWGGCPGCTLGWPLFEMADVTQT